MNLSAHEEKLVARLKRNQHAIRRWRWAGLFGALTNLGAGVYAFVLLQRCFQDTDPVNALFVAILFPVSIGLLILGGGFFIYILSRWNGKPETHLLLRLIDESHSHKS